MEILMKVKCSSSPNPNTIKIVDHHRQLQQQHKTTQHLNGLHQSHDKHNLPLQQNTEQMLSNSCIDYTTNPALDCCAIAAQKHGAACTVIGSNPAECPPYCEYATCCSGRIDYACCAGYSNTAIPPPNTIGSAHRSQNSYPVNETNYLLNAYPNIETQASYEYQEPEENFVSIEDDKIKAFLQKIGEEQKLKTAASTKSVKTQSIQQQPTILMEQPRQEQQQQQQQHTEVFEIIELDVARDVEKLQRLRESAEKRVKHKSLNESSNTSKTQTFYSKSTTNAEQHRKSPNICLVPKTDMESAVDHTEKSLQSKDKSKENIIARINLLDSDSEVSEYGDENNVHSKNNINNVVDDAEDDDDTTSSRSLNPLLAAAAVSCELGCDNDEEQSTEINVNYSNCDDKVYVVASDDEQLQFIDEREEGMELRWDDFEEHSNSRERQIFECHICAKTVQSNYNLRRHMMIHTGERPFGCDLCERRFREISDLKKHRRRHANQIDFLCMICRLNPPLESDSTRCGSCDTKNGTLIAAVRPDTVKPPPEFEHIFGLTARLDKRKSLVTNQVSAQQPVNSKDKTIEKFESTSNISATPPPSSSSSAALTPTRNAKNEENIAISNPTTFEMVASHLPAQQDRPTKELNPAAAMRALARKRETFKCPLCKRVFGTRHNLKRHFMIHTGEKPYSCPHCRKPFRELSTLKKHMVTHRRDRWYKCLRCPQKYRDFLDYMEHKSSHKQDSVGGASDFESDGDAGDSRSSQKKYAQDDAINSYDDEEDDETMEYDNSGDSLECCECGQRFTDIEQFSEHIKEHELNRVLYECYICQQLFDAQKDLVQHMNDKHQTEA